MTPGQLSFRLPRANWTLQFSDAALQTFGKHVQRRLWSKETVGQLFTRRLRSDCVAVEVATVLTPTWASWAKVRFDTAVAMAEREAMFKRGLHCIGLWHTHPEPVPEPSIEDRALAREHATAAKPELTGLVFAIVGTLSMPSGLRVWVDDGQELRQAKVLPAGQRSKGAV